jgi:hypothetical protein
VQPEATDVEGVLSLVHVVASLAVIVMGLALALVLGDGGDIRLFGWLLVVIGVLGLISRWVISRQGDARGR